MKRSKLCVAHMLLSVFLSFNVFLLILSAAISLPIYIRPFYYAHIDALSLPQETGYSYDQIRTAYDEMLDYLTIPDKTFSVGDLPYTVEGKSHFADCRRLFSLLRVVLFISFALVVFVWVLRRFLRWPPYYLGRCHSIVYGALGALLLILIFGIAVLADFDGAFTGFHAILFPGKDNWLLNVYSDPVVRLLPEQFFVHCGIFVAFGVFIFSSVFIIWCWFHQRQRKNTKLLLYNETHYDILS